MEFDIEVPIPKEKCIDKYPVNVFTELNGANFEYLLGYIYTQ